MSVHIIFLLCLSLCPNFPFLKGRKPNFCDPTVKGFGIVNKAEKDVFLELSCFFHDPADVGNLISGSSAFSKTSLNFTVEKSGKYYLSQVSNISNTDESLIV